MDANEGFGSMPADKTFGDALWAGDGALLRAVFRRALPGVKPLRCRVLGGGISAQMAVVEVDGLPGEKQVVLRRGPSVAREYHLMRRLVDLGLPVPRPLALEAESGGFPAPFLLMAFVEGAVDFSPADPSAYGSALAEGLARIHRTPLEAAGALRAFSPHDLTGAMGDTPAGDPFDTARIWRALNCAGFAPRGKNVLMHGDFWPGNILWRGGEIAAVVDWEDAAAGDPLADLAIARLDLRWIVGREAMDAFTARYFNSMGGAAPAALARWDLRAVLHLSGWAGSDLEGAAAFFQPYGRADITARGIRAQVADFTNEAMRRLTGRGEG